MLGPKSRVLTTSAQSFKGADNAFQQINGFPADKCSNTCSTIHQREIYHEDNTICPSSNQNQVTISSRNATYSCVKQKCYAFLPIMVTFIKIIKADCLDGSYSIPVFSSCQVGGQHCSTLASLPEIFQQLPGCCQLNAAVFLLQLSGIGHFPTLLQDSPVFTLSNGRHKKFTISMPYFHFKLTLFSLFVRKYGHGINPLTPKI